MLRASALANAITLVATTAFILCGVLSYFVPDLFWSITSSWLHAINIDSIKATEPMPTGMFFIGIFCFAVYVWVIAFAAASLYNRFMRDKALHT